LTRQRAAQDIVGGSTLQMVGTDKRGLSPSRDCRKTDLILKN